MKDWKWPVLIWAGMVCVCWLLAGCTSVKATLPDGTQIQREAFLVNLTLPTFLIEARTQEGKLLYKLTIKNVGSDATSGMAEITAAAIEAGIKGAKP
jgi:hypothetical protein